MENNGIIQDIRFIKLTKGKFTQVDSEDADKFGVHKWHYSGTGYAKRRPNGQGQDVKIICLASEIINVPNNLYADHIDLNKLNNTKINLRIVTFRQNTLNRGKKKGKPSSIYKGVYFRKRYKNNLWGWDIKSKDGRFWGACQTEIEAAYEYDKKAKELYGNFAYLNFSDLNY